ncbi:kinase-like domain-containing protein [Desarmillaria tabescens]|uniref:non-specific serine/threonine protein kinase n=1 Tax=Armillaria tabescens TaxID=1929756 RepID=A0AA39NC35_ARMTA|nr:kinase-like domain-containing protein [Desarmillaria tabescens]KAK0462875.1 kinase-like domain-containing protein [Desarmillaria tabescens]
MPFSRVPHLVGRSIANGRLILVDLLGSGNYGQVYKALDVEATNDFVYFAVKCIETDSLKGPTAVNREIASHAAVSRHPNVVTYRATWVEEDYIFMVMDYCPGGELHKAIREQKVFYRNDSLVKQVFLQIIDAVQHCHDNQIFHRDLKPENILCSEDGEQVFLADFGLATCEDDYSRRGAGTMAYKSPECLGEDFKSPTYSTRSSDVWALGVVFLNMIAGRSPWLAAKISDPCFNYFLCNPDYFTKIFPITPSVNQILLRVFDLRSSKRITLPELRAEITNIDRFFLTDAELVNAPARVMEPSSKVLQSSATLARQQVTVQPPVMTRTRATAGALRLAMSPLARTPS